MPKASLSSSISAVVKTSYSSVGKAKFSSAPNKLGPLVIVVVLSDPSIPYQYHSYELAPTPLYIRLSENFCEFV